MDTPYTTVGISLTAEDREIHVILGFEIPAASIIAGGVFLMLLLAFQMLVGLRVIHFKGRTHMKVHKWGAWALVAIVVVHASLATVYVLGLSILS